MWAVAPCDEGGESALPYNRAHRARLRQVDFVGQLWNYANVKATIDMPETALRKAKARGELPARTDAASDRFWAEWDRLAARIGRKRKSSKDAVQITREMRR